MSLDDFHSSFYLTCFFHALGSVWFVAALTTDEILVVGFSDDYSSWYNVIIPICQSCIYFPMVESMTYISYDLLLTFLWCFWGVLDQLHEVCNCALANFVQASIFTQILNHLLLSLILRQKRNFCAFPLTFMWFKFLPIKFKFTQ